MLRAETVWPVAFSTIISSSSWDRVGTGTGGFTGFPYGRGFSGEETGNLVDSYMDSYMDSYWDSLWIQTACRRLDNLDRQLSGFQTCLFLHTYKCFPSSPRVMFRVSRDHAVPGSLDQQSSPWWVAVLLGTTRELVVDHPARGGGFSKVGWMHPSFWWTRHDFFIPFSPYVWRIELDRPYFRQAIPFCHGS